MDLFSNLSLGKGGRAFRSSRHNQPYPLGVEQAGKSKGRGFIICKQRMYSYYISKYKVTTGISITYRGISLALGYLLYILSYCQGRYLLRRVALLCFFCELFVATSLQFLILLARPIFIRMILYLANGTLGLVITYSSYRCSSVSRSITKPASSSAAGSNDVRV